MLRTKKSEQSRWLHDNQEDLLTIIVDVDTNWHVLPSPSRAADSTEKAFSQGTAANVPLISCDDGLPVKLTVTLTGGKYFPARCAKRITLCRGTAVSFVF